MERNLRNELQWSSAVLFAAAALATVAHAQPPALTPELRQLEQPWRNTQTNSRRQGRVFLHAGLRGASAGRYGRAFLPLYRSGARSAEAPASGLRTGRQASSRRGGMVDSSPRGSRRAPPYLDSPLTGRWRGTNRSFPAELHHYDLHVWLFKENPDGMFKATNKTVSCAGKSGYFIMKLLRRQCRTRRIEGGDPACRRGSARTLMVEKRPSSPGGRYRVRIQVEWAGVGAVVRPASP